jgi:hypothetical protein
VLSHFGVSLIVKAAFEIQMFGRHVAGIDSQHDFADTLKMDGDKTRQQKQPFFGISSGK